jgi:enamine deaminase RidA (YjgF/YER057c/UK114 family)
MATLTMQEVQNVRRVLQEAATLRHKVARLESLLASLADEVATLTAKKHNVHGVEKTIAAGSPASSTGEHSAA